ncbi:hypothetical protein [Agreia sp. Leaf335]|uniref:hypothetical protein n=1 Tax=Agreia sp. Leaf335 TaxID=1736340 RepID=UPI0012E2ADEF|nr:hypothetical protein [Agreia sp. Leaf335]
MTWRRRARVFAAVLLGSSVLASGLAGCSVLLPKAPESVSAAAATAEESLSGAPGVASVSTEVTLRDYRGEGSISEPDAWVVILTVNAATGGRDLERAADEVVDALVQARPDAHITAVIVAPQLAGDVDAEILFDEDLHAGVAAERVTAARELSAVDGVSRVTVGRDDKPPRVEAVGLDEWAEVATAIRAVPGFGVGALQNPSLIAPIDSGESWSGDGSDGVHLELGALTPSSSMIEEITRLAADHTVRSISFSSGEDLLPTGGAAAERSSVTVDVETSADAEKLADRLAGLVDQRYWTQGSGRPSFQVVSPVGDSADSSAIVGYVGLPRGSAEPDDLPAATGVR